MARVATSGRSGGRRFDREHGVTTQALFLLSQLGSTSARAHTRHATHYEPVPVATFRALLARVPEPFMNAAAFVDVGCGMGRAVLLASEYPFKQVAGIEFRLPFTRSLGKSRRRARPSVAAATCVCAAATHAAFVS